MADDRGVQSDQTRGILFADLRGYTDFVERRGDAAGARLLDRYRGLIRGVVSRQQGAEIRTEGDSFFVLFPSASRAVTAALEIVEVAVQATTEDPASPVHVGVGVHAGETAELPEGPVGSAVNVAARICAQAKAGEVLVSDTVRGLTRTRQIAAFSPVGSRRLKGIAEPMTLYRAVPLGAIAERPVITSRLGRPTSGSWLSLGMGALALVAFALFGYAVLNGIAPPGATHVPGASGIANASPSPLLSGVPSAEAPSSPTETSPAGTINPTAAAVNGTRIIYSRQVVLRQEAGFGGCDGFNDAKLHVMDPDRADASSYRLTAHTDLYERSPEWSSDGSLIAFAGDVQNAPTGIFKTGPDGDSVSSVTEGALSPGESVDVVLAPDVRSVAYAKFESVWLARLDGSDPEQIAGLPPPEGPDAPPPTEPVAFYPALDYLPDGRLLIAVAARDDSGTHFEIVEPSSSDAEPLDFDLQDLFVESVAVAPDGDRIAFSAGSEASSTLYVGRLSERGADLEEVAAEITNAKQPAFSPDGEHIAFQGGSPGSEAIYVLDLGSGAVMQLTDPEEALGCSPSWSIATEALRGPHPTPEPGEPYIFERGVLPAGRHLLDRVQPNMELTFPEGWHSRRNYVDGWSVARIGETRLQEVDSGRVQVGLTGPCFDDEQVILGPRPSDLAEWIQGRADLIIERVGAINLGGYTGISMDVSPREGSECEDEPEFPHWVLFFIGEDVDSFRDLRERLRLVALDVRGVTVAFQVYSEEGQLDDYWSDHALPLLETLAFPVE